MGADPTISTIFDLVKIMKEFLWWSLALDPVPACCDAPAAPLLAA